MKIRWRAKSGAVLIFALLVLVVGATILGGIAQLAVTQTLAGQTEWESAARRIRLENSRAMARQYIMSQMWRGYGELPQATMSLAAGGGLGGFAITNVEPPFGYWLSMTQGGEARINPFNLFERGGFQSAWASGNLISGTNATSGTIAWGFQIRTRSPILAGFAFVNHRPINNTWAPVNRINMQQADYAVGFTNLPRMPVSSVTNANIGDASGFLGFLSVPKAEGPFGDLFGTTSGLQTNLITDISGAAPVTTVSIVVDLATFGYYNPDGCLFYEVPSLVDCIDPVSGNVQYNARVTQLVLQGGTTSGVPVQIFVPENNSTLTNIVLQGDNERAVYIYHRGSNKIVFSTASAGTTFRIGMTLFPAADLAPTGALTIVGGIRTRALVGNSQGTVTFESEEIAGWRHDAIADRMMWLEDQRAR